MILKKKINNIDKTYSDMIKQFPISELKPFEIFKSLFCQNNYIIYEAQENNQDIGYIIIVEDNKDKFIWVDYLAIFKEFHSKGFGSSILNKLKEQYKDFNGCYLEVEKPDKNNPNTIRRINFYKKHGAVKLPVDYYYPNKTGCLPMDLYYIPYNKTEINNILYVIKQVFNFLHKDIENIDEIYKRIKIL